MEIKEKTMYEYDGVLYATKAEIRRHVAMYTLKKAFVAEGYSEKDALDFIAKVQMNGVFAPLVVWMHNSSKICETCGKTAILESKGSNCCDVCLKEEQDYQKLHREWEEAEAEEMENDNA